MCGIAGFLQAQASLDLETAEVRVRDMADAITHRGPDSSGVWVDVEGGAALGHRRLAIVDLSPAGAQPMVCPAGRWVICYNGEIYNHAEIRAALEAEGVNVAWRGHSDTETLLAAVAHWGVEGAVTRAVGMFAFAVWDRRDRRLILGRDRMGEKPLYYGWFGAGTRRTLLFGSEMAALAAHPGFSAEIDRESLSVFLRYACVGGARSIFRNVRKVPPGTLVTIAADKPDAQPHAYWSVAAAAARGAAAAREPRDATEATDALEALLRDAIGRQMMSDVPLGAFLSGGVDSSAVVALMQAQSSRPVRTFSIGFHDAKLDEASHARAVARHVGADHTELYVDDATLLDIAPRLAKIYDEPFADASQIPTVVVSALARRHVTVSLSGDGGDELFCGYDRHRQADAFWRAVGPVPASLRAALATAAQAMPLGRRGRRIADYARSRSVDDLFRKIVSHWRNPCAALPGVHEPEDGLTAPPPGFEGLTGPTRMAALDMTTYLPDDILTKVDRAAMSVSLETRAPLLDHRVVEFALALPVGLKLRDGRSKWILREVLYRHVPKEMVDRPKMGFTPPVGAWLRGPLRDWAEALLDPARLQREGNFDAKTIAAVWSDHQSGRADRRHELWSVLMFQSWLEGDVARRAA